MVDGFSFYVCLEATTRIYKRYWGIILALYFMDEFYNNFNSAFKQIKHTVHDQFTQLSGVITDAN